MNNKNRTRFYILEYASASVILHAGCLALLFLHLTYHNSQKPTPPAPPEQPKIAPKKEPRIIMKRVPATPTPVISKEQESFNVVPHVAPEPPASTATTSQQEQPEQKREPVQYTATSSSASESITPPTQHQKTVARPVQRHKKQHSWYTHSKKPVEQTVNTEIHSSSLVHEMALSELLTTVPPLHQTDAQRSAEKFKHEFQEAGVNNYVSAVHHAIAFSLNRMRIMLAPSEIPPHILMHVTITAQGSVTHASVSVPGYAGSPLVDKIRQAIIQAAPFRPFPSSITLPEMTLTINAYPDGSYVKDGRYSSRATPLVFTLNNNHGF